NQREDGDHGDNYEHCVLRLEHTEGAAGVFHRRQIEEVAHNRHAVAERNPLDDHILTDLVAQDDEEGGGEEEGLPHRTSARLWQSMQYAAYGSASRRASGIDLPHRTHVP